MFVDDLVDGLIKLMNSNYSFPINLGNPDEYRISQLAEIINEIIGNKNQINNLPSVEDDPRRRKPDISLAKHKLDWEPKTKLIDGLRKTIKYFEKMLDLENSIDNNKKEASNELNSKERIKNEEL